MKNETADRLLVAPPVSSPLQRLTLADGLLAAGAAFLVVPTMVEIARYSWPTEQGSHGPLVLATGLWLLAREWKASKAPRHPGKLLPGFTVTALFLSIFVVARITGTLEIEAFMMYGALLGAAYLLIGAAALRAIWFPLVYLLFMLPPPESLIAAITQPIKIAISEQAVALLHALNYPIGSSGVMIQIGQHELLVAAACAGLNSILSLTAICLFYVYLRRRTDFASFLVVVIAAIPIAVFANFVRVNILILLTYHFGERTAQGFIHDFAGLLMFAIALMSVFAIDTLFNGVVRRRSGRQAR